MAAKIVVVRLDASGNDTVYSNVKRGRVQAITLVYGAGSSATADVLIEDEVSGVDLVNIANSSADAIFYPRAQVHDSTGNVVTYDGTRPIYDKHFVSGRLKMTTTNQNTGIYVNGKVVLEVY